MNRSAIRNLLVRCCAPLSPLFLREKPRRRIVALHDIPQSHETLFIEKMEWLKKHCHIVSLNDLASGKGLEVERLNIALSFDDGFKEYAHFVMKTLVDMNIPATFFTPSGALGLSGKEATQFSREGLKRRITFEFMTKEELKKLSENPLFTIGGHTTHHKDVATLDTEGLKEEITDDKTALEGIIGKPIAWFAYPFGGIVNISASAVTTIKKSGYVSAFSIMPSFWRKTDHTYLVGRDSLSVIDSDSLWHAWLAGGYDPLTTVKNYLRMKALTSSLPR